METSNDNSNDSQGTENARSIGTCSDCEETFDLVDLHYSERLGGCFCDVCGPAQDERRGVKNGSSIDQSVNPND